MVSYRFQVTPVHTFDRFPIDMLRYDSCWPERQEDATEIAATLYRRAAETRNGKPVSLFSARTPPTPERWESFGWRVVTVQKIR